MHDIESRIFNRLKQIYNRYNPKKWLWLVNFSGGKDSSALLISVLRFADKYGFKVKVLHSDTTVEFPIVLKHVREVLTFIRDKFNADTIILNNMPNFFTVMLERGYGFPRWNFRWCCRVYKYGRGLRYIKTLGRVVNMIGIRGDEKRVKSFIREKGNVVTTYPLFDLTKENVWEYIEDYCPWYSTLKKLYKYGNRLGCWVCTVISEDLSLKYLDPELYNLKIKLVKARCKSLKEFIEVLSRAIKKRPDAFPNFIKPAKYMDVRCRGKCYACTTRLYWWEKPLSE